jgi:hypothetical protein
MRIIAVFVLLVAIPTVASGQNLPPSYPPEGDRGEYYLTFTVSDSTDFDSTDSASVYPDQAVRDSIQSEHPNWSRGAEAIEEYALGRQDINFLGQVEGEKGHDKWNVRLTNGDTIRVNPQEVSRRSEDLTFEYYHRDHELIVFASQWTEGGGYVVVSRTDGDATRTFGPPVLSPSGKWFVAFNEDTVAGYSPNGLQLFKIKRNEVTEVVRYRIDRRLGGPTGCRWIDDSTFRLQLLEQDIVRDGTGKSFQHYQVSIREKK